MSAIDTPERPEIVDAPTPEAKEQWHELVHETVDEFVVRPAGGSGKQPRLHLSPYTFPGGDRDRDEDEENDEITPYCGNVGNKKPYRVKDVSVYPPNYWDVCDNCLGVFKHYHEYGIAPGSTRLNNYGIFPNGYTPTNLNADQ